MQWLKEHFIPRKHTGKLVVPTRRTEPRMLDLAQENVITIVCLSPTSPPKPANKPYSEQAGSSLPLTPYSLRYTLISILSSQLEQRLPSGIFPSGKR
jgi:hypothetical protein